MVSTPNTIPATPIRARRANRFRIESSSRMERRAWAGMDETAVEPLGQEPCRRAIGAAVVEQSPALAIPAQHGHGFGQQHAALDREAAPLQSELQSTTSFTHPGSSISSAPDGAAPLTPTCRRG